MVFKSSALFMHFRDSSKLGTQLQRSGISCYINVGTLERIWGLWISIYYCMDAVFYGGGYLRKYGSKFVVEHEKIILFVATILLMISYVLHEGTTGSVLYIARFLTAAALFSIFSRKETTEKWFWGASMFIYCTHFSIVSAIEKLMFLALGKNIVVGLVA